MQSTYVDEFLNNLLNAIVVLCLISTKISHLVAYVSATLQNPVVAFHNTTKYCNSHFHSLWFSFVSNGVKTHKINFFWNLYKKRKGLQIT